MRKPNFTHFTVIHLLFFSSIFGVSSSYSVNPFTKLGRPTAGVNEFSGQASLSLPVIELEGRNNVSIPVVLNYSSNVYTNATADNKVAPTREIGLGWQLSGEDRRLDHGWRALHENFHAKQER